MRNTACAEKEGSLRHFPGAQAGYPSSRSFARMMVEASRLPTLAGERARDRREMVRQPAVGASVSSLGATQRLSIAASRRVRCKRVREIAGERGSGGSARRAPRTQFRLSAPKPSLPYRSACCNGARCALSRVRKAARAEESLRPVVKIALRFAPPSGEQHSEACFHSPAAAFPTFWTPLPTRAPS